MRTCLYIGPTQDEWTREYFPGKSPGELPLVGKSWVHHTVDLASQLGVTDVYVADCFFREELTDQLGDGQFWSLRLHYLAISPCGTPEALLRQQGEIATDEDLLIFWGLTLPDLPDIRDLLTHLQPADTFPDTLPDGIWLLRQGKLYQCECPLFRIDSLRAFFDLNFRLLEHPGIYNLPGYSSCNGCSIGMDVVIMLDCELEEPVLLQDHVCLERGAYLHNGAIVGKNVLIDEHSELDHSIILDHVYVGRNICFRNKIVDGNRVIDADTGAYVDLQDHFLADSTRKKIFGTFQFLEWLVALFLVVVLALPYCLTLLFRNLTRLAFFGFLHRIYPKCLRVLHGHCQLVRYGQSDLDYAFRFSDLWPLHQTERMKEMDDVYYFHHRTVQRLLQVVFLSLLKRFFMLAPPDRKKTKKIGTR